MVSVVHLYIIYMLEENLASFVYSEKGTFYLFVNDCFILKYVQLNAQAW